MITNTANDLFSSSLNYISLGQSSVDEAKDRFLELQRSGVIKMNCTFDSPAWHTTDEYANVGLHFSFNRFSYSQYEKGLGLSFDDFVLYVKCFLISIFGRNALATMQNVLLDLRHIINAATDQFYAVSEDIHISLPNLCTDFFSMLPGAEGNQMIDRLLTALDAYSDLNSYNQNRHKRTLADFDTYFLFDEIIRDFWQSHLSKEERLFYYPLYLWWVLTGVLPLRPREFLLTERSCLSKDEDGTYYLRIRRNQLKGGRKSVSYKLSDDYSIDTYKIPQYLGDEIQQYLDLTSGYEDTEIKTLFVTDPHYHKWEQSKHCNSRFLTYMNMNTILKYFYREIVHDRYGLNVIYDHADCHLAVNEIGYIHLGDTRHIALINIMQEGGTPVTAMLLAGHNNVEMASHYYTNLKTLIECKTYRQYRRLTGGRAQYQLSLKSALPTHTESRLLPDGGRCYSKAYLQGDLEDCLATMGENGEIGYCPSCTYYRKTGTYYSSEEIYTQNLRHDCLTLKNAVDLARRGKGSTEDIGEALQKLRSSSLSYETYLQEKQRQKNNMEV